MKSTFSVLFYARKNYINKNGEVAIMVRITLNGEVSQFSSKLTVNPEIWDTKVGRVKGKSNHAKQINNLLEEIKASIFNHHREIERNETNVTSEKIRNAFLGITAKSQTLLQIFQEHNANFKKLIGKGKTKATFEKYQRTYNRLSEYMKCQLNVNDISIKEINYSFIKNFEIYLRSACSCATNTTAKYLQQFKHIISIAQNNGWINSDPFSNHKIHLEKVDRGYLTMEELRRIIKKTIQVKRLEHVRDIFIFSCFTGLAYIDIYGLKEEHVQTSFDDKLWIFKRREKTGIQSKILLLEIPKRIIEKYRNQVPMKKLLPVISNQKLNSYLKEIADLCEVDKNLTFHLARHTFATTVTLSKGVPIETVSKMLGHTNIKTTQIYARITDNKISNDMQELSKKLEWMNEDLKL